MLQWWELFSKIRRDLQDAMIPQKEKKLIISVSFITYIRGIKILHLYMFPRNLYMFPRKLS